MTANIRILLTIVFLDGMVVGIVIPAMPLLLADIQEASIQSVVIWGGFLTAMFGIAQLALSPYLGALSDVIGRRKVLLLALVGMAIEFIILLTTKSIWMLLLARAIAGAASANRSVISAAIADTHAEEDRAGALGKQTAAFAAGLVFGPMIGSLALVFGTITPFYLILALILTNIAMTILFFEETLAPEDQKGFAPSSSLKLIWEMIGLIGTRKGRLLSSYLFYSMAFMAYPAMWSYYAQGVLGWTPLKLALSMTVFCAFLMLANVWGIKVAVARFGTPRVIKGALAGNIVIALTLAGTPPDYRIRSVPNYCIDVDRRSSLARNLFRDRRQERTGFAAGSDGLNAGHFCDLITAVTWLHSRSKQQS